MPKLHRINPEEAKHLLAGGHIYVDVRSEPEFEEGHVPGAYNVPLLHRGPAGMVPNERFEAVMRAKFALEDKLILGCRSGVRSLQAAKLMGDLGYDELWELRTGWEGSRDPFGRLDPGWGRKGLPVELGHPPERSYADILRNMERQGV